MEPQLEGCGKAGLGPPAVSRLPGLQWSRNLRVAERAIDDLVDGEGLSASMEPQLEGCGKASIMLEAAAALRLQWSRNLRVAERYGRTGASA